MVCFPTYCKDIYLHIQKIYLSLPLLQTNSCLGHFTSVHHKPKFKECNCAEDTSSRIKYKHKHKTFILT